MVFTSNLVFAASGVGVLCSPTNAHVHGWCVVAASTWYPPNRAGPAYVVYKVKQRKKKRQLARAEMQPVLAGSQLPADTTT
jgi:hypothetical protein